MSKSLDGEKQEHLEHVDIDTAKQQHGTLQEYGEEIDIHDEKYNKKLNRRLDRRVLPLCCWVYLLNFLDRARAKWLSNAEKKFAVDRLADRGGGYNQEHATRKEILDTCFSPRMLLHYIAYVADVVPQGSFTFFTPTIVTGLGYVSALVRIACET
ncbi:unnamed protein product [Alternaria alternata]